jgi:hypothetical protein
VSNSPYANLPESAFWRPSVAERHAYELALLPEPPLSSLDFKIATAGSCFAQHIGRHLRQRGAGYLDLEPAPEGLTGDRAARFGFGTFSCRYGNIYTTRQLRQLLEEALGKRVPLERVWEKAGRFYDALRPSVDPVGHDGHEDILSLRRLHLKRVNELIQTMEVFVFTLGLTEAWQSTADGTVYPSAPGVIAGAFDPSKHGFVNFRYPEVLHDLQASWQLLRSLNPKLSMILTVSPVPLIATASGEHVLVANTHSKSTLRAVAGDFARDEPDVTYFPSYELIVTHPSRAMFFNPDLRTVNSAGVEYVMSKFFGDQPQAGAKPAQRDATADPGYDLVCDEEANDPGG